MCKLCYNRGYGDYPDYIGESTEHEHDYNEGYKAKQNDTLGIEECKETDFCHTCFENGVNNMKIGLWIPPLSCKRGHYESYLKGYYPENETGNDKLKDNKNAAGYSESMSPKKRAEAAGNKTEKTNISNVNKRVKSDEETTQSGKKNGVGQAITNAGNGSASSQPDDPSKESPALLQESKKIEHSESGTLVNSAENAPDNQNTDDMTNDRTSVEKMKRKDKIKIIVLIIAALFFGIASLYTKFFGGNKLFGSFFNSKKPTSQLLALAATDSQTTAQAGMNGDSAKGVTTDSTPKASASTTNVKVTASLSSPSGDGGKKLKSTKHEKQSHQRTASNADEKQEKQSHRHQEHNGSASVKPNTAISTASSDHNNRPATRPASKKHIGKMEKTSAEDTSSMIKAKKVVDENVAGSEKALKRNKKKSPAAENEQEDPTIASATALVKPNKTKKQAGKEHVAVVAPVVATAITDNNMADKPTHSNVSPSDIIEDEISRGKKILMVEDDRPFNKRNNYTDSQENRATDKSKSTRYYTTVATHNNKYNTRDNNKEKHYVFSLEENQHGRTSNEGTEPYGGKYTIASTRVLKDVDVASLSQYELTIMLNEIYARHGQIFSKEDMKSYFSTKYWYSAELDDVTPFLTIIEKQNILLLERFINAKN